MIQYAPKVFNPTSIKCENNHSKLNKNHHHEGRKSVANAYQYSDFFQLTENVKRIERALKHPSKIPIPFSPQLTQDMNNFVNFVKEGKFIDDKLKEEGGKCILVPDLLPKIDQIVSERVQRDELIITEDTNWTKNRENIFEFLMRNHSESHNVDILYEVFDKNFSKVFLSKRMAEYSKF